MHFKTEKSYVSADIRLETVIFAGIMRCGLFSYIGCAAMLLLGYLPVWADGGRIGLLEVSPVAILLSENGAAPEGNVSIFPDDTYSEKHRICRLVRPKATLSLTSVKSLVMNT